MAVNTQIGSITGFNANVAFNASAAFKTVGDNHVTFFCKVASGDPTGLIAMVQFSPDGTTWYNTKEVSLAVPQNANFAFSVTDLAVDCIRLIVLTASTAACTLDIDLHGY